MVGLATGTAVFLSALPAPTLPMLGTTNITSKQTKRSRIQKMLAEAHTASLGGSPPPQHLKIQSTIYCHLDVQYLILIIQ